MSWHNYYPSVHYNNYAVISAKSETVEELHTWYTVYSGSLDITYFCTSCKEIQENYTATALDNYKNEFCFCNVLYIQVLVL